ncbi:Aldo/keto reductase family, partial [Geosmithia morbida]
TSRLTRDLALVNSPPSATKKTTIPKLVYGTAWKKEQTADLVYMAIANGFRGIDTAAQPRHYDEKGVATGIRRAITDGIVRREDLFIQTKFTAPGGQSSVSPYDMDASLVDKVHQSVQSSLRNFTFDAEPYIDSLVLHSPLNTAQETLTVWNTLSTYTPHPVRNLGISNVTLPVLESIWDNAGTEGVRPAVVQNRFHDLTGYEVHIRAFCREMDVVFQSFWTLSANPSLASSEPVVKVARGAGIDSTPAAYYALVLGLEGVTVLDGTTSEDHMRDDLGGVEAVGIWAEGEGREVWEEALREFKGLIGEPSC